MESRSGTQIKLLDTEINLPMGLVYRPEFITPEEEADILSYIEHLPLHEGHFEVKAAGITVETKRRHFGFGWDFDDDTQEFVPGPPLPPFLDLVKRRIAKWLDISPERIVEALVNEYKPGTPIGWHRDNEPFEHIVGISLAGWARMRFRPLQKFNARKDPSKVVAVELEPRSAYIMQKNIRWKWQHSVAETKTLRYSITFRTLPKGNVPIKRGAQYRNSPGFR